MVNLEEDTMSRTHWMLARFSQLRKIARIERMLQTRQRYLAV